MAQCSGCRKRFKKGEVFPWTDRVFRYEFCRSCHPQKSSTSVSSNPATSTVPEGTNMKGKPCAI